MNIVARYRRETIWKNSIDFLRKFDQKRMNLFDVFRRSERKREVVKGENREKAEGDAGQVELALGYRESDWEEQIGRREEGHSTQRHRQVDESETQVSMLNGRRQSSSAEVSPFLKYEEVKVAKTEDQEMSCMRSSFISEGLVHIISWPYRANFNWRVINTPFIFG